MILPVSANPAAASHVAAPAVAQPAAPPVAATQADSVHISKSAQVKQLHYSGMALSDIEVKTGLDAATVKLYLGK